MLKSAGVVNMFTMKELNQVRKKLNKDGIFLQRNVDFTKEELINLGEAISPKNKLLEWDFGKVMEMKHSPSNENYLFSDEGVPLHWDGAFHEVPAYIIFYCTNINSDKGGESLFVNTTKLFQSLNAKEKEELKKIRLEFSTEKLAHYGGKIEVPLLADHRSNGQKILRIASEVKTKKNPVKRRTISGSHELCQKLDKLAHEPSHLYEHQWLKGDLLIVDNDTFLHGRNPLGENTARSFYRVQAL